jgi:ADP-heptose:LPS heptosyltransferase
MKTFLKSMYFSIRTTFLTLLRKDHRKIALPQTARILIFRLDRVGDLVLTTPLFPALRKRYPRAHISVMVRKHTQDIIRNEPSINEVIVYSGFIDAVTSLRKRFDLVIDPLMDYGLKPALLSWLLQPRFSLGFEIHGRGNLFTTPVVPSMKKEHFVDSLFELLAPLDIPEAAVVDRHPSITVDDRTDNEVLSWVKEQGIPATSPLISLHPGAFYPSQRWLLKNFTALVTILLTKYPAIHVLLLGTSSEQTLLDAIIAGQTEDFRLRVHRHMDKPLLHNIDLIKRSILFIGNNSGLLHIASAVLTPTLSTMGPTVPWTWHPYGDVKRNVVLRKDLPCSPCSKAICDGHACMAMITVDEMFRAAELLIETSTTREL